MPPVAPNGENAAADTENNQNPETNETNMELNNNILNEQAAGPQEETPTHFQQNVAVVPNVAQKKTTV